MERIFIQKNASPNDRALGRLLYRTHVKELLQEDDPTIVRPTNSAV
jgi:hypothetical protein